jgi:hypothetical protein
MIFNKPITVIYVEKSYNKDVNLFIQSNFKRLADVFYGGNISFIYLPLLLISDDYKAILDYNYPYLNSELNINCVEDVYQSIIEKYNLSFDNGALISIDSYNLNNLILHKEIDLKVDLHLQFINFLSDIKTLLILKNSNREQLNLFSLEASPSIEKEQLDTFDLIYDETLIEKELNRKLQILIEQGAMKMIGAIIEKLQNATQKLSKLLITEDYRIFLKDYGMREVVMSPLPKSLFILFLKHPEGIPFKCLSEFDDELFVIYKDITRIDNMKQIKKSINALIDPLNNSINEKCSRIRASFLKEIPDYLAMNYYITGYKGEPKRIILNSSLIEFQ